MNIKKLLIVAVLTLQMTGFLHASQAAYNTAFLAFANDKSINPSGGAYELTQAAQFIQNARKSKSWTITQDVAQKLKTPQAMAVGFYLSSGTTSSLTNKFPGADSQNNLMSALTAAQNSGTGGGEEKQPLPQIGDNNAANWTTAITAFGGSAVISAKTATKAIPNTIPANSPAYPDAKVILQYLNNAEMNDADRANLNKALADNQNSNDQTTDAVAQELKKQIEDAKQIYNLYKPGTYTRTA